MSARAIRCDACVVGGGPAGSVVATRLARLGRRVVLIERSRFPRARLGESLTPGVRPMLESIEAGYVLEGAGAVPVGRVHRHWGASHESRVDPRAEGRLVDRATLDAGLLLHARLAGVEVLQPASVVREARAPHGWSLDVQGDGVDVSVQARVLVHATGRGGRGGVACAPGPRTIALYAYWGGAVPDEPGIESLGEGWAWGVPVPGRGYNVLVFVDAGRVPRGASLDATYAAALERSRLVAPGPHARRTTPVRACDATPGVSANPVDDAMLRVGDAAVALDPLSSSGVQQAIQHALAGAIVANTLGQRPDLAPAARSAWTRHVTRAGQRHSGWAATHYASVAGTEGAGTFWVARAHGAVDEPVPGPTAGVAAGMPLTLSPHATLRHIPVFEEEFVAIRAAVHPPALEDPVAFIGGHPIDRLLEAVTPGITADALVARWDMAPALGHRIAAWMHRVGLLVPAPAHA